MFDMTVRDVFRRMADAHTRVLILSDSVLAAGQYQDHVFTSLLDLPVSNFSWSSGDRLSIYLQEGGES